VSHASALPWQSASAPHPTSRPAQSAAGIHRVERGLTEKGISFLSEPGAQRSWPLALDCAQSGAREGQQTADDVRERCWGGLKKGPTARKPEPPPPPRAIGGGRAAEAGPDVVQDAEWLTDWKRRMGYTDGEAADALAMSIASFRRQRRGVSPVSPQTALLALYATLRRPDWLSIAELAHRLARSKIATRRTRRNGNRDI
jgi:hypothetical protein